MRHLSKYGANWIKTQAHDHPKFRTYAERYGQTMHQFNMRMQVTLLRDKVAEKRAREKAEAPTVKTEQQALADKVKAEKQAAKEKAEHKEIPQSVWRRKFRPLPENKAIDLFADVIGDSFILSVAVGLIMWEYIRNRNKPDTTAVKLAELKQLEEELNKRQADLEEAQQKQQARVETLEQALEEIKKVGGKKGLLTR